MEDREKENEISKFKNLGRDNFHSAMILWSLNFIGPSIWLLQFSLECYLKAIYIKENSFKDINVMKRKIKDLSRNHELKDIFNKLSLETKNCLTEKKFDFSYLKLGVVRYLEEPFGYSKGEFNKNIRAINILRYFLGDNRKEDIIKYILSGSSFRDETKIRDSLRNILHLRFPSKKKFKKDKKEVIKKLQELY